MNRRRFLSVAAAAAVAMRSASGQAMVSVEAEMPAAKAVLMPVDFTGLSYETAQLYNADYFSTKNTVLVDAFRKLAGQGVLRLGAHLSDVAAWEGVGHNDAAQQRAVAEGRNLWEWKLVDPGARANRTGAITRRSIENLRGFLDAVNWRLLYGLNLATGSAARAADEASAVASVMGDRLIAFQVGSEADGFEKDGFRSKGYDFTRYFAEYETFVKAVRAKVPAAKFAGPDTSGDLVWLKEFARRTHGDAVLLTSHFYAIGPASDPAMDAKRMLQRVNTRLETEITAAKAASAEAGGVRFRMCEGNSCFGGGKDGVSNAYASALWVADYMLHVACAGYAGVNPHGGGDGLYAPIESTDAKPVSPRPMYYGMQFAEMFAGWRVAQCDLHGDVNATAYVGERGGKWRMAVVNKSGGGIRVTLPHSLRTKQTVKRWILQGPALDAKDGTTFAATENAGRGMTLEVPRYAGVVLEMS